MELVTVDNNRIPVISQMYPTGIMGLSVISECLYAFEHVAEMKLPRSVLEDVLTALPTFREYWEHLKERYAVGHAVSITVPLGKW
jgi:hypothetical protein